MQENIIDIFKKLYRNFQMFCTKILAYSAEFFKR